MYRLFLPLCIGAAVLPTFAQTTTVSNIASERPNTVAPRWPSHLRP